MLVLLFLAAIPSLVAAQAQPGAAPLPEGIEKRSVTIWSKGTRLAGDLYLAKDLKPDDRLPAVVFCNGVGGTKAGIPARLGPMFAREGYVFLAFDYRGWGQSDSKLMMVQPMPKPDEKGEVTVRAKAVRWTLDGTDQPQDIRCAIDYLAGEPNVDPGRIGLMGSSYGGGLITYVAADEPRVR